MPQQAGKTERGILLRCRQGLLLDHSGMQGGSSWITFESIVPRTRHKDLSLVSGMGIVAIPIPIVPLPCAASSTRTWVNQQTLFMNG